VSDTQHGYVVPLPGGRKADCGGPTVCQQCADEAAALVAKLAASLVALNKPPRSPLQAPVAGPATAPAAPVQAPSTGLQDAANGTVEPAAVDLVVAFEGFSAVPYQDPAGVWTIGYGSTRDAQGQPITARTAPLTEPQAKVLVSRDLMAAAVAVAGNVQVNLTHDQRAALQDFVYNLGAGNFRSSTLLRKLNAGDFEGAAAEFDKWDMAGGKVLAGLLRRRQAETDLFKRT